MINFENVTKQYKRSKVLDGVSFSIKAGEFVTLIGPSGAGKSTLVYLLIGAERPSRGVITVDGYRISEMKQREKQYYRRRIGVVFQDYRLLPQKTVAENVSFALEVCGYNDADIKRKVAEVLRKVGLTKHARKFPHQLSGGEKQRCSIARALVHSPSLIIADEPTGNLDPATAFDIAKLLQSINAEGITVVLTTHNKDLVNFLKRRVIKLQDGRVVGDKGTGYYE